MTQPRYQPSLSAKPPQLRHLGKLCPRDRGHSYRFSLLVWKSLCRRQTDLAKPPMHPTRTQGCFRTLKYRNIWGDQGLPGKKQEQQTQTHAGETHARCRHPARVSLQEETSAGAPAARGRAAGCHLRGSHTGRNGMRGVNRLSRPRVTPRTNPPLAFLAGRAGWTCRLRQALPGARLHLAPETGVCQRRADNRGAGGSLMPF